MELFSAIQNSLSLEAAALKRLSESIDSNYELAVQKMLSDAPVIVTGIGKSGIIAQKWVATFNSTGQPAQFLHAAEAIHGDLGMVPENSIVFCLSKSGNSEEIQFLVNLLKLRGVYIIGVCANTESHLAKNASLLLFTPMEKEACPNNLAPTVSTTLQLAVGDSLAVALMHARNFTSSEFAKHHPGGALGKYLFTRVKDILRPNSLAQVNLESSLQEVLMEISSKRMGATTVFNNSQLCGFITDGDIRRYFEKNKISESTEIKALHLMSTKPLSIETNALAVEAFRLMEEKKINQLLVCENLIPVGIIHIHDIIATGIR